MTSIDISDDSVKLRRGFPVFEYNPSAANVAMKTRERTIKIEQGSNVLLINGDTSEILGEGTAAFLKREVVDDEQFMKVFVGKLDIMFKLTKTGQHIFQIVWDQVQNNKDKDTVLLRSTIGAVKHKNISDRVFQKGVRELLEKKFIFMGQLDGIYYINMGIFFNGSRIIAATEYIRSSAIQSGVNKSITNGVIHEQ